MFIIFLDEVLYWLEDFKIRNASPKQEKTAIKRRGYDSIDHDLKMACIFKS